MKANRCDDDAGLIAELVQFSPSHVLQDLLCLYNDTLFSGEVPSLNPVRVSRTATVRKGHGNRIYYSIIMVLNKTEQKPVHGTTIVPHDGQQSSMMNEKHVRKKPGVDHPIASVDDLGAYEVAHGNFFHKNS